jgi:hypothetical protein
MSPFARRFALSLALFAAVAAAEAVAQSAAAETKEYAAARYKFRFAYPANGKLEERALPARGGAEAGFEVRLSVPEEEFLGCAVAVHPQRLADDGSGKPPNLAGLLASVNVATVRRDLQPLPNSRTNVTIAKEPDLLGGQPARRIDVLMENARSGTPYSQSRELRTFRSYGRVSVRCYADPKNVEAEQMHKLLETIARSFRFE